MKYWKSIIILILTIFLFSIATVCASDANDTAIASEDQNAIEIENQDSVDANVVTTEVDNEKIENDVISSSNEDILNERDNGTFTALQEKINNAEENATITLENDYTYDEGFSTEGISINKALTIEGKGFTIDAKSKSRAFSINGVVTLKNLIIKNANYDGMGGAIYFSSSGTVTNCNFTNNHATYGGGAIYFSNSGSVTNCNFTNNQATGDFPNGNGGAIYFAEGSNGNVTNCNFTNNQVAFGHGGAIYFYSSGTVENCNFVNNIALRDGGAIYMFHGAVENCNFTNNQVTARGCDGGAIYFKEYGTVENCNFTNNQADLGAVFFEDSGNVTNCNFINNHATGDGGAIFFVNSGTVTNCNFTNNHASYSSYGGAIKMDYGTVTNSKFINNTARLGGAIWMRSGNVTNCNFTNNAADSWGGAIYNLQEGGVADTCIFKTYSDTTYRVRILPPTLNVDNFTTYYGSGEKLTFDLKTNSSMPVYNGNILISVYYKNNGSWAGNYSCLSADGWTVDLPIGYYYAVFNTEYAEFKPINRAITVMAPNTTFWALDYAINANDAFEVNLTNDYCYDPAYDEAFANGIVINRKVTVNGNGHTINANGKARVFNVQASDVTIKNLTFKNANANGDGGAIYFKEYGSVENCNFINNTVKSSGGAIGFAINGNVENCNFTDNKAGVWAGSIYFDGPGTVTNCNFSNNAAGYLGGAILFIRAGNMTNCSFTNNSASDCGGAVYFSRDGDVTNCSFTNNNANSNGGGIYFAEDSSSSVMNCKFANNTAADGGAIFRQKGQITADTSIFKTGNDTINSNVNILAPTLNVDNFTTTYNSGEKLTFDLKTNSSMPVNGNISISIYYKNNGAWMGNYSCLSSKGWTVVLQAGSYYALFNTEYAGFEPINSTITVNKLKTSLAAKAVIATYNVNKYLVITLKDANGKPLTGVKVTVNLNGAKKYTSDKNGQFKVATKSLAPKKYTAKITFNGNTNYVKSTKSVKITIKKATPKLTAKKKTFKVKKAKKYTITLKTNKKKALKKGKVTLTVKVKGKKIKIIKKTNKKGKATFNLKKLNKKGKYTAVVKFAGNKYYKAKTVKAKITVR